MGLRKLQGLWNNHRNKICKQIFRKLFLKYHLIIHDAELFWFGAYCLIFLQNTKFERRNPNTKFARGQWSLCHPDFLAFRTNLLAEHSFAKNIKPSSDGDFEKNVWQR
jgi:hypothetical protein